MIIDKNILEKYIRLKYNLFNNIEVSIVDIASSSGSFYYICYKSIYNGNDTRINVDFEDYKIYLREYKLKQLGI